MTMDDDNDNEFIYNLWSLLGGYDFVGYVTCFVFSWPLHRASIPQIAASNQVSALDLWTCQV